MVTSEISSWRDRRGQTSCRSIQPIPSHKDERSSPTEIPTIRNESPRVSAKRASTWCRRRADRQNGRNALQTLALGRAETASYQRLRFAHSGGIPLLVHFAKSIAHNVVISATV